MKHLKTLFLLLALGIFSTTSYASPTPCGCVQLDDVLPSNSTFFYGANGLTFNAGFGFNSPCGDPFTVTFDWNFGDGNTQSTTSTQASFTTVNPQSNINHNYANGGSYYVCVTVTFTNNWTTCVRTFCEWVTIVDPCDLVADFHPLVYDPKVRFIDISRANEDTRIVAQEWTIDGKTFNGNFVDYVFGSPGTYDACLTVTAINEETGQCCIDSICKTVTISSPPAPCELDPGFSFSCFTDDCIFKFSGGSGSSNRNIISWFWDFGDGRTGTGQNIFHTYTNPGQYEVCLTIVGENGDECCYEKFCRTITFNCNGIDLTTLPACDQGQSSGGGNSPSNRVKEESNIQEQTPRRLNVFPNPSSGNFNFEIETEKEEKVTIEIIDATGKRSVLENNVTLSKGLSNRVLSIGERPSGVYTISIVGENFRETKSIVINR